MVTGHRRILPVVLAGGTGTRLWPVSTSNLPKQFQPLLGTSSTYEKVLRRLSAAALFEEPIVITALPFQSVAAEQASRAGVRPHIVLEPVRRDSAAAIAAAALLAMAKRADQPVLVVAADHAIDDDSAFIATVQRGMRAAETDGSIVVFGLRPDSPRTSFGYIKPGTERTAGGEVLNVDAFVEKPDLATAERYVAAGYLWNSGNFLFRADAMVDAFRTHAPDVLLPVSEAIEKGTRLGDSLLLHQESFSQARATSVDYAIMEKASNIVVVPGNFAWSDVGSWDAVWQMLPQDQRGNATVGMGQVFDADNTLVHAQKTLTVAAGVKDLAVITTEDAVLVFPRARSQDVKDIARTFERITFASRQEVDFPKTVTAQPEAGLAFETVPYVKPTGFREYDARWWYGYGASSRPPEINLMGAEAIGLGIGTMLCRRGLPRTIVVGHDYRSYSASIKNAMIKGLIASGVQVTDVGLGITPMAYFAQFELDTQSVAMVTASHNENGWTGIKMGFERPLTFGPAEMAELKAIVLSGDFDFRSGGTCRLVQGFAERYMADLTRRPAFSRKLKVVVACGNGTAGAFAPEILSRLGAEVIPLHTTLDHSFPNYNPNPEDMHMLHDIAAAVLANGADVGLGFDGDGDRCGVVDNEGHEIFADKIGLMLARDLSTLHRDARFVVDVKSTCLFEHDQVLAGNGASTDYFKTGHSYIKRRVQELSALAGFEKSGHFFFNAPVGRGYDDGMVTAIAVLDMLSRNPGRSMADLYRALPRTWGSPTMSAECADEVKYEVVAAFADRVLKMTSEGAPIGGYRITSVNSINGVRIRTEDGTWGLVRASSNKSELVVVVESPISEQRLRQMFQALDQLLREDERVGKYNQSI